MTRLIRSTNASLLREQKPVSEPAIREKINTVLDALCERFDNSEDNSEKLAVLNNMDELVSAEIFYWSNVLNDLPENCPPCMESKGNEAKNQIAELTPIVDKINKLRIELLAD